MRNKMLWIGIGVIVGLLLATAGIVLAGDLNPSVGPTEAASQMYTLEQIYSWLATGAAGTKMTAFTEPAAGPGCTMRTLDDIMAAAPAVDDANGAGLADVASGKTFWGVTEKAWGLQTGTGAIAPYAARVPKTGQTTIYAPGDDGDLQRGVAWPNPRFTDNLNGTVTDNLTGLIWLKNANCFGSPDWATALTDANGLASLSCGLTDGSFAGYWRLPNVRELQSLIDYGRSILPALPSGHPFIGVQLYEYWTSTTLAGSTSSAWYVGLHSGSVGYDGKSHTYYVWPVRGGQ
jgi:hypothetical protein